MPSYQFTVRDSSSEIGSATEDLPDLAAARAQVVERAAQLLKIVDGTFWSDGHLQVEVSDPTGLMLCAILISGVDSPALGQPHS